MLVEIWSVVVIYLIVYYSLEKAAKKSNNKDCWLLSIRLIWYFGLTASAISFLCIFREKESGPVDEKFSKECHEFLIEASRCESTYKNLLISS